MNGDLIILGHNINLGSSKSNEVGAETYLLLMYLSKKKTYLLLMHSGVWNLLNWRLKWVMGEVASQGFFFHGGHMDFV